MKIAITGIAGFLGSHLADRMIELGHEVVGNDNLLGGDLNNLPDKAKFYNMDCNNLDGMTEMLKDCDIVYHAACVACEGLSIFSPAFIYDNTAQITMNTITAAIRNNVKRFVYCSSMARYGTQEVVPFTEDMVCKPIDPYGVAKYSSEEVIKILSNVHGIEYVIAVPHNIIGPRQKYDDPFRNVVGIMINMMLQGRQPYIYGDGNQRRSFSFVNDDIYCLEKLAFDKKLHGEVINIGPDTEFVTINEVFLIIADILNFDLKPIYVKDRPQEVKLAHCSAEKARMLLDYKKQTSLHDGIKSMVDWIKKEGTKPFKYHLPLEIINDKCPSTWKEQLFL